MEGQLQVVDFTGETGHPPISFIPLQCKLGITWPNLVKLSHETFKLCTHNNLRQSPLYLPYQDPQLLVTYLPSP